ncbi:hypothetical protein ACSBOB_09080 [Mesorhizobium sp. ASY16-5R]|jgi:hypothetical protein|uniref:hypothetical protein n=1 Tax=Mesorhizobium sp. ASY16-5R TaxID=3445772 RepID=UPI003F9F33DF
MTTRAENFMDKWLDENITPLHINEPALALPILAERCLTAARKSGLTVEEVEEVVCDIEEAIRDELTFRKSPSTSSPDAPA